MLCRPIQNDEAYSLHRTTYCCKLLEDGQDRARGRRWRASLELRMPLLAVAVATFVTMGCSVSEDPPKVTESAETTEAANAVTTAAGGATEEDGLDVVVRRIRAELRDVPGRTGILKEERVYSVFDEELIIRDFFQDRRDGFFLDVGCAWPVHWSNTYYLEERLGWTGIGIDALASYGPGWAAKRPRSKFFNNLVTDHSGADASIYTTAERPGLSSTNPVLASGRMFGEKYEIEEVAVPAITLNVLLEREGVEKIDLLSMDIEFHEKAALAGFDIERYQPDLAVIEGKDPDVARYFESHGYKLIERYLPFDDVNRYYERIPSGD